MGSHGHPVAMDPGSHGHPGALDDGSHGHPGAMVTRDPVYIELPWTLGSHWTHGPMKDWFTDIIDFRTEGTQSSLRHYSSMGASLPGSHRRRIERNAKAP